MTAFFIPKSQQGLITDRTNRHNPKAFETPTFRAILSKKMARITTEHLLITIHFLETLRKRNEDTEKIAPVRNAYANLLDKEELIIIMQNIYNGEAEYERPGFTEMSKRELLAIIKDEYYILEYLIEEVWKQCVL